MDINSKSIFQRFVEKKTSYLIGLYIINAILLIIYSVVRFFSTSYTDPSSVAYYLEGGLTILLVAMNFITPAYSIFYVIICLWKEEGIKRKLLKVAILPLCYLLFALVGYGLQAVLDTQKEELRSNESYLEVTYSVPSHWKGEHLTIQGRDEGISYLSNQNMATFDVYAEAVEEGNTLKEYVEEKINDYKEQNCSGFEAVTNLNMDIPYYYYTFSDNEPEGVPYFALLMFEHKGKFYEFLLESEDSRDLEIFHRVCESIELQ